MRVPGFPFPALVGLDTLKLALQLAAIDRRLSVLIRGDKGGGKSTAARSLVDLLDPSAPFLTLPIGATDDRLLGGLDLEKTLAGEPALKPGLLAEANDGVLYVDEVNLLPDHLADALLDAVASGTHVVEREGFSVTHAADFVLVGSMNPEEGTLRPQLLDRFALAVDVEAPLAPDVRCQVLERRLAYDSDPERFQRAWRERQVELSERLAGARGRLLDVVVSQELLRYVATCVTDRRVRSLRADLAAVRASRAYAALVGAAEATTDHADVVLPLALAHRAHVSPPSPQVPPQIPPAGPKPTDTGSGDAERPAERTFVAVEIGSPRLVVESGAEAAGKGGRAAATAAEGHVVAIRPTTTPRELDVRSTVVHAVTRTGTVQVSTTDLHDRVRAPRSSTRYIFVVDSSGSLAVHDRMGLVKGAVASLLDQAQGRHDQVVVIACRGAAASVLLEPSSSREEAARRLEYLPTGGRTPLAHALELATTFVTDDAAIVLVTDGHANVACRTDDAWADALAAARAVGCPALVIDTEDPHHATRRPQQLADAMRGACVPLADLDRATVIRLIRDRVASRRHTFVAKPVQNR